MVQAVIEESHARKLRVAVHATELEAARAAVEEGADLLVHSVTDQPVDAEFVRLMKERGTLLTPTLVVFERYGRTFANRLNLTPEEKAWGNPEVIATLDVSKLPPDKVPERIATALGHPDDVLGRIQKTYDVALKNLKTLEDAGIPIAAGTDAGNIGTIHGPRSVPGVPAHERSWPNEYANPSEHYRDRRQSFRRSDWCQDRISLTWALRGPGGAEFQSAR